MRRGYQPTPHAALDRGRNESDMTPLTALTGLARRHWPARTHPTPDPDQAWFTALADTTDDPVLMSVAIRSLPLSEHAGCRLDPWVDVDPGSLSEEPLFAGMLAQLDTILGRLAVTA